MGELIAYMQRHVNVDATSWRLYNLMNVDAKSWRCIDFKVTTGTNNRNSWMTREIIRVVFD